jgi:hypothetical protein
MASRGRYGALEVCGARHAFDEASIAEAGTGTRGDRGRTLKPPSRLEQKRLLAGNGMRNGYNPARARSAWQSWKRTRDTQHFVSKRGLNGLDLPKSGMRPCADRFVSDRGLDRRARLV